jgi:tRNA threonylcarbamoyladenosine biosynthesis protein TsaE
LADSVFTCRSPEETVELGKEFSRKLKDGDVVALYGQLGAGKTTFVRGVVSGLKAKGPVASPTFVLLNIYSGKIPVHHFDFYRLENSAQLETLNLEDYLYCGGVCLIEWPEMAQEYLNAPFYEVHFEMAGENERRITIRERIH